MVKMYLGIIVRRRLKIHTTGRALSVRGADEVRIPYRLASDGPVYVGINAYINPIGTVQAALTPHS